MNPRLLRTSWVKSARVATLLAGVCGLAGGTFSCQRPSDEAALVHLHQLESTLLRGNDKLLTLHAARVQHLEAQVQATRNRPADKAILDRVRALHDSTRALTGYLRDVRDRLQPHTRQQDALAQLKTRGAVGEFMQAFSEPANSLPHRLRRYARFLQRTAPGADTLGAGTSTAYQLDPVDFGHMSLAAALAALARYETAVLLREHMALEQLGAQLTPSRLKSLLQPMVSAQSGRIAPGGVYRAEVRVANVRYHPGALSMTANGQALPVGADGIGHVVLPVPTRTAGRGQHAYWDGTITVQVGGRDSTFRLRVPYPGGN